MSIRARLRTFPVQLGLIAFAALLIRAAYVRFVLWNQALIGDEVWYYLAGANLARGNGFIDPVRVIFGPEIPSALHPPFTQTFVGGLIWVFGDHQPWIRLLMSLVGVAVVVMLGLFGRRIAGPRVGLLAAGIGAVYTGLWVSDGLVMAESMAALVVIVIMWLAYNYLERPRASTLVWLSVTIGIMVLNRAEYLFSLPFLVLPIVWVVGRGRGLVKRILPAVLSGLIVLAVIAPWTIYNSTRFEHLVLVSNNGDTALRGVSCDESYPGGALAGLWGLTCAVYDPKELDESVVGQGLRRDALEYIKNHLSAYPEAVLLREGRAWNLYLPFNTARYNEGEGRPFGISVVGILEFYVLVALAVFGWFELKRRRISRIPLASQFVIAAVAIAGFGGMVRFRVPADVALVVLAAVAIDGLFRRRGLGGRGADGEPGARSAPDTEAAEVADDIAIAEAVDVVDDVGIAEAVEVDGGSDGATGGRAVRRRVGRRGGTRRPRHPDTRVRVSR